MKTYTAIYSTAAIKNIQYSFNANNMEKAIDYCKNKFSAKDILIVEGEYLFLTK